mgnify:CR=1 FL=1
MALGKLIIKLVAVSQEATIKTLPHIPLVELQQETWEFKAMFSLEDNIHQTSKVEISDHLTMEETTMSQQQQPTMPYKQVFFQQL